MRKVPEGRGVVPVSYTHLDVYKRQEADLVFDVRCLPNPYYIPELKEKSGLDKEVRDYVMSFERFL